MTHEFPFRDEPYTEDLGKGAREYTLEAHVIGEDHEDNRDRLIQAVEGNKSPGILVHPIFGALRVVPGPVEHIFDNAEGNIEYFNFTFYEAGENRYPGVWQDAGGQALQVATLLSVTLALAFERGFTVRGVPGFVEATARETHNALIESLRKITTLAPTQATPQAAYADALRSLGESGNALLSRPAEYAATLQSVINAIQGLFREPAEQFAAYARLSAFGDHVVPIPGTSPNRRAEKRNRDAQVALVKRQALIGLAIAASRMTFPSYDDAVAVRTRLSEQLDNELDVIGGTDEDAVFNALSDLKAAMILDITARSANLARIRKLFPAEPLPALVLAYAIYGEIQQAEEIRVRNGVRNPNFMPAGRAIQILVE